MRDSGHVPDELRDLVEPGVAALEGPLSARREGVVSPLHHHQPGVRDLLQDAVDAEDLLGYGEPPQWLQPTRHTLGAVYLLMDEPGEAERVYREDLAVWKENGWSLFGLMRSLEMQGRGSEAAEVRARYDEAWKHADEVVRSSCRCVDKT